MAKILSEFHFSRLFIDGACFQSPEALHAEFAFKLGLPDWYGRNWDALLNCLASIGTNEGNLCFHWDWSSSKRLVLSIRGLVADDEAAHIFHNARRRDAGLIAAAFCRQEDISPARIYYTIQTF